MEDNNELKYDDLSNSELRIKLVELENRYDIYRHKIKVMLEDMEKMDYKYNKIKVILNKRTKGVNI